MSSDHAPGPARLSELSPERRALLEAVGVAAGLFVAYLLLRISPVLTLGALSDDGIYVALGKALAEGQGYRSIYAAGDPVHLKYPPGLPAVHAVLWWISDSLSVVHRMALELSAVVTAASAGVLWWVARRQLGAAAWSVGALVLGPLLLESSVQYLNLAISEPWFLLGWACALAWFPRVLRGGLAPAFTLGAVAGVTALFRSQALVSIPAFVAAAWMLRPDDSTGHWRRSAAVAVGALLPVGVWRLWHGARVLAGPVGSQPDEGGYADWFPTGGIGDRIGYFLDVVQSNVVAYGTFIPDQLARPAWFGLIVVVGLAAAALVGAVRQLRRRPDLVLPLGAQLAVVMCWPFAQDRFLVPLLPFLGLLALGALPAPPAYRDAVAASMPDPGAATDPGGATHPGGAMDPGAAAAGIARLGRGRLLNGALAVVVLVVGFRQAEIRAGTFVPDDDTVLYHPSRFLVRNALSLLTAGRWIEANTSPDDVVLAPFAPGLFLYTGRKTVNAEPAQPDVGSTVFDPPGRFLARRAVEDGVTILVLMGAGFDIVRDVAEVQRRCPGALRFLGGTDSPAVIGGYRVELDACLREMAS